MTTPRIARSDLLKRWHTAANFQWAGTANKCANCMRAFRTGDVIICFGALDVAIAKKAYLCPACGIGAMHEGHVPSGAGVFVELRHKNRDLDELDKEVREYLVEGFVMVDRISEAVATGGKSEDPQEGEDQPS